MTQSPIEPRHKDMAAKALDAAYFAEYGRACGAGSYKHDNWLVRFFAQTLANDEAKCKALAEIEKLTTRCSVVHLNCIVEKIAAIAAPYRASDPVAEALPKLLDKMGFNPEGRGAEYSLALAALKRGMELARSVEGNQR